MTDVRITVAIATDNDCGGSSHQFETRRSDGPVVSSPVRKGGVDADDSFVER